MASAPLPTGMASVVQLGMVLGVSRAGHVLRHAVLSDVWPSPTPLDAATMTARTVANASAREVLDAATDEAAFQKTLTRYADLHHWLWYHPNDSRRDRRGFPDLVLVRGERVIFAELKKVRRYPTKDQRAWLSALRDSQRVEVFTWRPSDWERIEEVLR